MERIIRIALTVAVFLPMNFMFTSTHFNIINAGGLKFSPMLAIAFGVLSAMVPMIFNVGVQSWKKSSFVPRLQPYLVLLPTLYFLTLIPQTYATAVFASYIAGLSVSYAGRIITPTQKKRG